MDRLLLFPSLTDRTDRMTDLTDCISASILDMSALATDQLLPHKYLTFFYDFVKLLSIVSR